MKARFFLPIFTLLVFCPAVSSFAENFRATLLASYELDEVSDLNVPTNTAKDPSLSATWPVLGGVNGVPAATEGNCVLKLNWTNEADHKVEVRHDWNNFTFDLAGMDFIHVDVYVASESAMPDNNGVGIWDVNWKHQWIDASCEPVRTNEWRTISFCVADCNEVNLDHIEALVFDKLAGVSGTIYIDNIRLGPAACNCLRKIRFANYYWSVLQSEWPIGAGPNYYTDEPNDVWVDPNGHLHLNIVHRDPSWYCNEVVGNMNLGYGTYVYTIEGRKDLLDPNIVLGLFIYDVPDANGNPREIDFELSRWWHANEPNNAQYVVQPWNKPNHRYRFPLDEHRTTTHEITWTPRKVCFKSYYGDYPLVDANDLIDSWCYEGNDIPLPGNENPRINFYLLPPEGSPAGTPGAPPSDGQEAEVIIKNFLYLPVADAGADQTVYAWIDGIAKVNLDGSGSCGGDNQALSYLWSWTIDGNTYDMNGVKPTIELPAGQHVISLVVNDGLLDSVPDDVNITVIAPLKGKLNVMPCTINRRSNQPHIFAVIEIDGIAKSDINTDELLTLYPGGIKAMKQWVVTSKDRRGRPQTTIFAFFDKDALMAAVPQNGDKELKVAGKLKSGQYFYGCDTVKIIRPPNGNGPLVLRNRF